MRAIIITRPGGPDVLAMDEVPAPVPGPRQIRVRVHATAVNRADLLQRRGGYPAPAGAPENVPGLEYAGVVEGIGSEVRQWGDGDRVMGLVGGGAYAEYIIAHEDEAIPVPAGLPLENAAAIPEAFITAHDALFTRVQLQPRESLLIHAVGSGVGTAALQLAKTRDAFVLGTQRSGWKLERARALGLDVAIEAAGSDDFAERAVREVRRWHDAAARRRDAGSGGGQHHEAHSAGKLPAQLAQQLPAQLTEQLPARADERVDRPGVDSVLDLVGGDYLAGNLRAIRVLGRIIVVGLVAGAKSELDMRLLLQKRATIIGTVLRARSLREKIDAARAFTRDVLPLLESGAVKPIIDEVFPLSEAAQAHRLVEENRNFGKIVLTM